MEIGEELRTCVVLGGRTFVGKSLVSRLLSLDHWIVRVADSAQQLDLDDRDSLLSKSISDGRASYFSVDLRSYEQLIKAIDGSSVVFYVDDVDSYNDDFFLSYTLIVQGAKNVVNACRECKVKRLVYQSTADVVFDGSRDVDNGDESLPYAWKFENMCTDLRAQAEALVLFANDIDGLLTCALRPSNIFGPGEKQLVPSVIDIAKSRWAKYIIGCGEQVSDFTYVENVAHALVCAEEALCSQMVTVSGKAFFVTNLEPTRFWDFVSLITEGLGYRRSMIQLPSAMFKCIFLYVKWVHTQLNSIKLRHLKGIHSVVRLAASTKTFNCSAAQKHIGYSPIVSMEDGVALTVQSFSNFAAASSYREYRDFNEQSKVDKLLGGGKVADILLWRDERKSFAYFGVLVLVYYWIFLCGNTFISSAAQLLVFVTFILYAYGELPSNISGVKFPKMSASSFEISEVDVKRFSAAIAHIWNRMADVIRLLDQGQDWNTFFKVVALLYLLKWYVFQSLTASIGVAIVLAFTLFFVYEQYEEEIDGIAEILLNFTRALMGFLLKNLPVPVASLLGTNEILHEDDDPPHSKDHI
ncbi:3beta-hydroxysteroid-dehydrogenase/decarboxylase [Heracleum sosnowskyi]|uniref:Reticulon-like protein n=1 Tax=Heracleum sosnowskyi TaxID=360622 RepID=A0AAD8MN74_9APIA|nr:3beta-hydroxysteroid-dehydrogenase/decarboxylase [Heracleum sosnowskyi]